MPARVAIALLFVALFVFSAALLLRRRQPGPASVSISEIRQKLEAAGANAQAVDTALSPLRARYGDQVPAVDAFRLLRELPPPPAATPASATTKFPDGVTIEWTPAGFLLRATNPSWIAGLAWLVFVAVLCAIPFVVFPDLIRSLFDAQGLGLFLGIAFLAAWAGGAFYALATGAVANFGAIRVSKSGDDGEIFTGIGSLGRVHRVRWSDFYGTGDRAVAYYSNARFGRTSHYIGLNGTSASYKFGDILNDEQRTFVIAFLRQHVFALAPPPIPDTVHGKTIGLDRIQQTLAAAQANYHGPDPEGFRHAADEFLASLRAQYGDQIPAQDAIRRLEKLARATGAPIAISF